jgi:signal transduction histidine kinase
MAKSFRTLQDYAWIRLRFFVLLLLVVLGVDGCLLVFAAYTLGIFENPLFLDHPLGPYGFIPFLLGGILVTNLVILGSAYYGVYRRVIRETQEIADAIIAFGKGEIFQLETDGILGELKADLNTIGTELNKRNTARMHWVAGVVHDLKTPLVVLIAKADNLVLNLTDEQLSGDARIIVAQARRISEALNSLTMTPYINVEMQPIRITEVRVAPLLREAVARVINFEAADAFTFNIEIPDDLEDARTFGDSALLIRAFVNVLRNAMTHNPDGCNIRLQMDRAPATERRPISTRIVISDDGLGVSHKELMKIVHRIRDLADGSLPSGTVHGFGLFLVKEIVRAHGGTFRISAKPNLGFTVTLTFPPQGAKGITVGN